MSSGVTAPSISSYLVDDDILTLDGAAVANSIVTIYSGTTAIGTASANASGTWEFNSAVLANGTYSISATDAVAGISSAPSPTLSIVVDSPPPPVITGALLNGAYQENITGTAEANATVVVYEGTTELGTTVASGNGAWSFTTSPLSGGSYSFTATEIDTAGDISAPSSVLTATVNSASITSNFFGMTIEAYNYDWGPTEEWPTFSTAVVRSWDVWSPGNGQIQYLDWADLNPSAGTYNWAPLDAWIAGNEANNAQMVYTFGNVPSWAGGSTTPNLADFQAFVTAIVTQANGAIKYWEGFNEFDVSGISPAVMVQLQEIIYNTVHSLDPGGVVLSPTVSAAGSDGTFAQFLADGGGQYFDIAAFHGYNNDTGEGLITTVQDFQNTLAQYGLSNKPIWDTEWGMEAPYVLTGTTNQQAFVSTGLILQAALGVQTELFYAYDNANSALYDTATGQLTPAGVAYQETEQWLTGATEPSGYQLNGTVYTVQLLKNGQSDLIVWNSAGQSTFSAGPFTQYVNAEGQVESIAGGTVTIGAVPILLETPDVVAPTITAASPGSTAGQVTLTGTATAGSAVIVSDGSGQLGTATANANGSWSFATAPLATGTYSFTAVDSEFGDNSSASSPLTVGVDTPVISSIVASGTGISNGNGDLDAGHVVTLTLTMSETVIVANGTPTLTLNDGGTATYTGGSGSNALTFSYTVVAGQNTPDLAVNSINLNGATITDQLGNSATLSGISSLSGTLQIDTTPPAAPVIAGETVNTNNTVTLSGTATAGTTITLYDGQTALGSTTATASGTWTYTSGTLANGSQTLTASATDAAGNVSALSNAVDPIIGALTGLQAASLAVASNSVLDITGAVDNTGTISLDATSNGADLAVIGNASLTGNGHVNLSNNAGNAITSNGAVATLTNINNIIAGAGTIGDSYLTLINQGTIDANGSVPLVINTGGNTIINSGTLEGTSTGGVNIDGKVSNSKTIEALGTDAKVVIAGQVADTTSGLILASGSGANVDLDGATISGGTLQTSGANAVIETVASSVNSLNAVTIKSGSTVEVNANTTLTLTGTDANSGTILVNGGTLNVDGTLSGGSTELSGAGIATIEDASSENIAFAGKSTAELVLDQPTSYAGQISGFGTTQAIDLADINFGAGVSISYASNNRQNSSGVLTIKQGSTTVHLTLEGSYTLANFKVASDGNGGTLITDPTVITQAAGNAPATIGNNTVLEIDTPDKGSVTFAGTSGTLWLDQPSTFTGKVSGFGAQNAIDLPAIAFGAQTTLGYSQNSNGTGGTLTVTNGTQNANIALLGNYMASSFALESDSHGGTLIVAEAQQAANQPLLSTPHHG